VFEGLIKEGFFLPDEMGNPTRRLVIVN
jgi:hypothetical protein